MTTWFSTQELHALGLTAHDIKRRFRTGELHRLAPGLYTLERPTPKDALIALQHHYPSLIFTGETALAVHGIGPITAPARGLVGPDAAPLRNSAIIARRSRRLSHELIDGLRLTPPLRSVVDAQTVPPGYRRLLERHYQGWRGRDRFHVELKALTKAERDRAHQLTEGAVVGASSEWERRMLRLLQAAGLDPIPNFPLGPYHWDFGLRATKHVIDLDSWRYHGPEVSDRTFIVDRWKTNHAVRKGWSPLRFTDLCTDVMPGRIVEHIVDAVNGTKPSDQPVWKFHPVLY